MTNLAVRRAAHLGGAALVLVLVTALASRLDAAQPLSVADLIQQTHFHGLAVDHSDPSRLYLATHHGLYAVGQDGAATPISDNHNDYMGFTPHPSDAATLYASGHPAGVLTAWWRSR
jgi:hypothetical protein